MTTGYNVPGMSAKDNETVVKALEDRLYAYRPGPPRDVRPRRRRRH
ncbi:hypothetical protein [Nocardioides solisilvae]|nr:hypothetical protein [Nocardioides solisilvae]